MFLSKDGIALAVFSFGSGALASPGTTTVGMPGSCAQSVEGCLFGTASNSYHVDASGKATASASVSITSALALVPATFLDSSVRYYFEIVGPANTSVPVDFDEAGAAAASPTGSTASASIEFSANTGFAAYVACASLGGVPNPNPSCDGAPSASQGSFSVNSSGNLTSDVEYGVTLLAQCDAASDGGTVPPTVSSCTAFVEDPITIDPSFANASEFSIEFSPNPPITTPEPSTLPMLGVGMAGLVGVFYSRKRLPLR